jgi:hypothetical protein
LFKRSTRTAQWSGEQIFTSNVVQSGNQIFATWISAINGGTDPDVELRGRFYDLNGVALGDAFEINTTGQDILPTMGQNLKASTRCN